MGDVHVGRLMSSPVRTVTAETSVRDAAQTMIDHDISSVVVVDGDNDPEGILTSTDYVRIAADDAPSSETAVRDYMATDMMTTTANDRIADVAETMMASGVHHVPVVDDTEGVVGMVTTKDFAAYLSDERLPSPPRTPDSAPN